MSLKGLFKGVGSFVEMVVVQPIKKLGKKLKNEQ